MSGVMWLETPHEALVVPPRRWKAPCRSSKSGACCVRQHAENAGASVRTLARLFQAALGMGFAEWRRQVQLATAVAELIQGVPISTIARDLGYSPSSFSDMFRRELGMSPSQYPVGEGAA
jgi:AraC-like DNA-binding protein